MDGGAGEVGGNRRVEIIRKVVPTVFVLRLAKSGVGDANEEASKGNPLVRCTIEVRDLTGAGKGVMEGDQEWRVASGIRAPADGNPGMIDEVEVLH